MSGKINFSSDAFLESVEPGITSLVMNRFQAELDKELQGAVDRARETLKQELPSSIKSVLHRSLYEDSTTIHVEVSFDDKP